MMNVALWLGQGLLAAIFLVSGLAKSTQSIETMLRTGQTAAISCRCAGCGWRE
jgi:hypothetical protein